MAVIYLCPADKRLLCSWEGYASDIKQHFEKEHNGLLFHTNSVEIDLNILPENRLLYLHEEIYLIQSYMEKGKLFLRLRYLGPASIAAEKLYNVAITVHNIGYKYEKNTAQNVITPIAGGWQINIAALEDLHGKLQSLICTILIETIPTKTSRKASAADLKINNAFIERNACDEIEENYLDAINFVDEKLEKLKRNDDKGDIMDNISQLNLSILEESFPRSRKYSTEDARWEPYDPLEALPDISEETNLCCTSCKLDMLPPIYICINGHNVCNSCRKFCCKECGGIVTQSRNTDLENISRTHNHPCRYSSEGCNKKLPYQEIRAHEAQCTFCKFKCQSDDCVFMGRYHHFINHLKIVHSSIKISTCLSNEFPKNKEFYITHEAKGIFYCKSELQNDTIVWRAIFCGPKERQFFCELYFKGSKNKEPLFLKRHDNVYEIKKTLTDLKKIKAKEKYAFLNITSYDS